MEEELLTLVDEEPGCAMTGLLWTGGVKDVVVA